MFFKWMALERCAMTIAIGFLVGMRLIRIEKYEQLQLLLLHQYVVLMSIVHLIIAIPFNFLHSQ